LNKKCQVGIENPKEGGGGGAIIEQIVRPLNETPREDPKCYIDNP